MVGESRDQVTQAYGGLDLCPLAAYTAGAKATATESVADETVAAKTTATKMATAEMVVAESAVAETAAAESTAAQTVAQLAAFELAVAESAHASTNFFEKHKQEMENKKCKLDATVSKGRRNIDSWHKLVGRDKSSQRRQKIGRNSAPIDDLAMTLWTELGVS